MGVFEIVFSLVTLGLMLVQGSNGNPAMIRLGKGRSEKHPAELNKSLPAIIRKANPECSATRLAGLDSSIIGNTDQRPSHDRR